MIDLTQAHVRQDEPSAVGTVTNPDAVLSSSSHPVNRKPAAEHHQTITTLNPTAVELHGQWRVVLRMPYILYMCFATMTSASCSPQVHNFTAPNRPCGRHASNQPTNSPTTITRPAVDPGQERSSDIQGVGSGHPLAFNRISSQNIRAYSPSAASRASDHVGSTCPPLDHPV